MRLAPFVERWAQRAARKTGEFMVEREDENNILTEDDEDTREKESKSEEEGSSDVSDAPKIACRRFFSVFG